ncbi:WGR domain-containing protein [Candidatus Acetothermia bacterium]|nr:WGR domain-containing protein [Candidatus Acetothermia bacterium]
MKSMRSTIRWQSIDSGRNRYRFYSLSLSVDLWGGLILVQHWGRIGTKGQRKFVWGTPEELEQYALQILRQRELHGYTPVHVKDA